MPENVTWLVFILDFIVDYLTLLLFVVTLIVVIGFLLIRKKHSLNDDILLGLVWRSVVLSMTLTYVIGTFDYFFNESSCFNFGKNDVAVLLIPGVICIVILAVSVFYKYISKLSRKGKNDGGDR